MLSRFFLTEHQSSAEHSLGNADEDSWVNKHFFVAFVATVAKRFRLVAETLCMCYHIVGRWHNILFE